MQGEALRTQRAAPNSIALNFLENKILKLKEPAGSVWWTAWGVFINSLIMVVQGDSRGKGAPVTVYWPRTVVLRDGSEELCGPKYILWPIVQELYKRNKEHTLVIKYTGTWAKSGPEMHYTLLKNVESTLFAVKKLYSETKVGVAASVAGVSGSNATRIFTQY